ncbi:hypothetical protein DIPPA_70157 [Diplonema papillatum]|nr:hypothetical protein DIPPA_70157 [Diplonema papillatum]
MNVSCKNELVTKVAEAIVNDGGAMPLSQVSVRLPWLRHRLSDTRLVEFLRRNDHYFEIVETDSRFTNNWKVVVRQGAETSRPSPSMVDVVQLQEEVLSWCAWVVKNGRAHHPQLSLRRLVSSKKVQKHLHNLTRATGCCDAEAFSPGWWQAATDILQNLLAADQRFISEADSSSGTNAQSQAEDVQVSLSSDGRAFVSDSFDEAKVIKRLKYLLLKHERQSLALQEKRQAKAKRRQGQQHDRHEGTSVSPSFCLLSDAVDKQSLENGDGVEPQSYSLPISKLGGDETLQALLQGRSLEVILTEYSAEHGWYFNEEKSVKLLCFVGCSTQRDHDTRKCGTSCLVQDLTPSEVMASCVLRVKPTEYVVVNKPSGMRTETLADYVFREHCTVGACSVDTVSRLDKPTSGVLIIPLSPRAHVALGHQFRAHLVRKTYLALVSGRVDDLTGTIDAKLKHIVTSSVNKSFVHADGLRAVTRFTAVGYYQRGSTVYTLLEVRPETGRTHQIRAHMAHAGHPLVADGKYSGIKRAASHSRWCPRLFLHASELSFECPVDCCDVSVSARMPSELEAALSALEKLKEKPTGAIIPESN